MTVFLQSHDNNNISLWGFHFIFHKRQIYAEKIVNIGEGNNWKK